MNKYYYDSLTGVRAIAAFMVYLHHYNPGNIIFNNPYLKTVFHEFHIGVTIFFTLSGFLITRRYASDFTYSLKYIVGYFIKRFARIYPLYILLTLPVCLLSLQAADYSRFYIYSFILNLTLLKGFSLEYAFTGLAQTWSLTVEECFYIFAIFLFAAHSSTSIRKPAFWLAATAILPTVGFLLVVICNYLRVPFFEDLNFTASYTFFGRFTEFFLGSLLAIFLGNTDTNRTLPFLTYGGIILFLVGIFLLMRIRIVYGVNFSIDHLTGVITNNVYLPICLIVIFSGLLKEKTFISNLLSTRVFSVLGKSSYAFYLIHMGFIHELLSPYFNERSALGAVFMFFTLVVLAIALHYFIEEPANKIIRSFASRSRWLTPTSSSSISA